MLFICPHKPRYNTRSCEYLMIVKLKVAKYHVPTKLKFIQCSTIPYIDTNFTMKIQRKLECILYLYIYNIRIICYNI